MNAELLKDNKLLIATVVVIVAVAVVVIVFAVRGSGSDQGGSSSKSDEDRQSSSTTDAIDRKKKPEILNERMKTKANVNTNTRADRSNETASFRVKIGGKPYDVNSLDEAKRLARKHKRRIQSGAPEQAVHAPGNKREIVRNTDRKRPEYEEIMLNSIPDMKEVKRAGNAELSEDEKTLTEDLDKADTVAQLLINGASSDTDDVSGLITPMSEAAKKRLQEDDASGSSGSSAPTESDLLAQQTTLSDFANTRTRPSSELTSVGERRADQILRGVYGDQSVDPSDEQLKKATQDMQESDFHTVGERDMLTYDIPL